MDGKLTALLQLLLQRKNLHQKVYLDPNAIDAEIMEHVRGEHKKAVRLRIVEIRRDLLVVTMLGHEKVAASETKALHACFNNAACTSQPISDRDQTIAMRAPVTSLKC
jgi:hypothetical protein